MPQALVLLTLTFVSAPPSPPIELEAYADLGLNEIVVKWTDDSLDELGFRIYRRFCSTGNRYKPMTGSDGR